MSESLLPFGKGTGQGSGEQAGRDVTDQFVAPAAAPLTVSALVARIKEALLDAFPAPVSVVGQISNFKRHTSGHLYFSLKDESATIDAVMFRPDARGVRFDVEDGLEVVATGRVDVYERQGRLQLYVQRIIPKGTGALELAFRQLKDRLQKEGLFDPRRKKPIPTFPRAIGVVTSPTGAAIRDISNTLKRRWPAARVYLVPVRVQGEGASEEIAEAIGLLDAAAEGFEIDTILLARGGGSLEDLWAFNEEPVARAIFAARTPILTGVGHEVDFTIADFVADVRAATPTAAAELAVPDAAELRRSCDVLGLRLRRRTRDLLEYARSALAGVQRSVVFRDPTAGVRTANQRVDELATRMWRSLSEARRAGERRCHQAERALAAQHPRRLLERAGARAEQLCHRLAWALGRRARLAADALAQCRARFGEAHPRHLLKLSRQRVALRQRQLESLSYRAPLKRGYSITRVKGGGILRSAAEVKAGDLLESELLDGRVDSRVARSRPNGPGGGDRAEKDNPKLFEDTDD